MALLYYIFAVLFLAMTSHQVTGQASTATQQCTAQVQAILKTCSNGAGINETNFLWFTTNGTSKNGQTPADEAAFRNQICQVEIPIGQCVLSQMAPLFNSSICQSSPQVAQSVDNLFSTYNTKCADPCSNTLINYMRQCFTEAGLSTDLFLNNRTGGDVIGDNEADVTKFCSAKDTLLNCLKLKVDACPASQLILSGLGFDLPSYEQVVTILCAHPHVYVTGLGCFNELTPAVEACVQKNTQTLIQTSINAQQQNWTVDRYIAESCLISIGQIKCDLEAWAMKKHPACVDAVIGLRREVECKLLPPNCTAMQSSKYKEECNDQKFLLGDRDTFPKPGSSPQVKGNAAVHTFSVLAMLMAIAFAIFV